MPLKKRASKKIRSFDLPVSYKMGETRDRLRDAMNVFSNQGRLETRYGRTRYNDTTLGGSPLSMSYFEHANGQKYLIAKVGTVMYVVDTTGAHTSIKTGLSANTKHRGVTWARGSSSRHIISIEEDGLFQFDGTDFSQLGQEPPSTPSVAATTGAIANGTYRVAISFYSSITGFESNLSSLSANVTTSAQGIAVTSIPATAPNATIDKVYIYIKPAAGVDAPTFVDEIALGVTSYNIIATPTSTDTAPTANAKPIAGGAKYISEFNRRLVYSGNPDYPNDVYFSEEDLPDAFNDGNADGRLVLFAGLNGSVTGLATGLYSNSVLDPFLVVFKRRSTHIYSEISGEGRFIPISAEIGCVSHDTITVKNGVVYFLSEQGFRAISNGALVNNTQGSPATLGDGDIDDIFRSPGYAFQTNPTQLVNAFSVYYSTLDQYMTWVAEGANNTFSKTYVYENRVGGFKPYEFLTPSTCACTGQEDTGEVVYMADADGFIYRHSSAQDRYDHDSTGSEIAFESYASLTWLDGDDLDKSFNFRELLLRRLAGCGDLTVRAYVNYGTDNPQIITYENALAGFILDISKVDIDAFGTTDRSIITGRADINQVGENLLISFYQNEKGKNIGLVSAQIDFNSNGNRN